MRELLDYNTAKLKTALDHWFRVIPDEPLIQEFITRRRTQINSVRHMLVYVIMEEVKYLIVNLSPAWWRTQIK